jgi:hypothetical protein
MSTFEHRFLSVDVRKIAKMSPDLYFIISTLAKFATMRLETVYCLLKKKIKVDIYE